MANPLSMIEMYILSKKRKQINDGKAIAIAIAIAYTHTICAKTNKKKRKKQKQIDDVYTI